MKQTSGYCFNSMGINPHPTYTGIPPQQRANISSNIKCQKHPHGLWQSCCSECLYEVKTSKSEKEDNRSFQDMFLKTHGIEPKKESEETELTVEEELEYRTKSLDLAIKIFGDSVQKYESSVILNTAQRFYTYITKGE